VWSGFAGGEKMTIIIKKVSNGFIVDGSVRLGFQTTSEIYKTWEEVVNRISFALGVTNVGEKIKLCKVNENEKEDE
jgi:hypothetical protein